VQAPLALVASARVLSKVTKEVSPSASSGEKGEAPGSPRAESASSSSSMERDWWALLGALLQGVHDRRPAVRGAALQAMFTCLNLELGTEGVLQGEVGRSAYRTFVVGMYSVLPVEPPAVAAGEAATASAPAAAPAPTPEAADWLATTGVAALSESERCFCRHSGTANQAQKQGGLRVSIDRLIRPAVAFGGNRGSLGPLCTLDAGGGGAHRQARGEARGKLVRGLLSCTVASHKLRNI
jgi:hypothetical protein